MSKRTALKFVSALSITVMIVSLQSAVAQWGNQPAGSQVTPDPWPKIVKQDNATYTLYQPQLVLKAIAASGAVRWIALTNASNSSSRLGGSRTPAPITTQS